MLLAVIGFSLFPLLIVVTDGSGSPFVFAGFLILGQVVAGIGYVLFKYPHHTKDVILGWLPNQDKETIGAKVKANTLTWPMGLCVFSWLEFGLFAWSTRYVHVAISTMIFEIKPIFQILYLSRLLQKFDPKDTSPGRRKITISMVWLMVFALSGVIFVIVSQLDINGNGWFSTSSLSSTLFGVLLVCGSTVASCMAGTALYWGQLVAHESQARDKFLRDKRVVDVGDYHLEMFFSQICIILSAAIMFPIVLATGWIIGETFDFALAITAFLFGTFLHTPSDILWRRSNYITHTLAVNGITYTQALFSLIWLLIFWNLNVSRVDLLVIGACGIIAANILLNSEAEIHSGFKATVIMLWTAGTITYLRDDSVDYYGGEYFGILALSATIFALILGFRINREASQIADENGYYIALLQKVDLLLRRDVLSDDKRDDLESNLRIIDKTNDYRELNESYIIVHNAIEAAQAANDPHSEAQEQLMEVETELNVLVKSKQGHTDFGELFVLTLLAGITVSLSLFGRPSVTGWTALLSDSFIVLFSAAIVFLLFNVWDLRSDRYASVLGEYPLSRQVLFKDIRDRLYERWISVIICLGIITAFIVLLWDKWLGV